MAVEYFITDGINDGWADDPDGCGPSFSTNTDFIQIVDGTDPQETLRAGITFNGSGFDGTPPAILTLYAYYDDALSIAQVQSNLDAADVSLRLLDSSLAQLTNPWVLWDSSLSTIQSFTPTVIEKVDTITTFGVFKCVAPIDSATLSDAVLGPDNELTLLFKCTTELNDNEAQLFWAYDGAPDWPSSLTILTDSAGMFNQIIGNTIW